MNNIWNPKIQELCMSNNKDNLLLAMSLVDDPRLIMCWYIEHFEMYELPYWRDSPDALNIFREMIPSYNQLNCTLGSEPLIKKAYESREKNK